MEVGRFAILFLVVTLPSFLISQSSDEPIVYNSVSEWIETVNNWPDKVYYERHVRVHIDPVKDKGYTAISRGELESFDTLNISPRIVTKPINVWNLDLYSKEQVSGYHGRWLCNIQFKEELNLYRTEEYRLGFKNCRFEGLTQIRLINTRFWMEFRDCHFKNDLNVNNPEEPTIFRFYNCQFDDFINFSAIFAPPSLQMYNCHMLTLALSDQINKLLIRECTIDDAFLLRDIEISKSFEMTETHLGKLDLSGANFPEGNTYLPFHSLSQRLVYINAKNEYLKMLLEDEDLLVYTGRSAEELKDRKSFDMLIASYYKLLNIYKEQGEKESYNECFIEMRDKVTARARELYKNDPSFGRFFDLQVSIFTKVFSDYGTRPAKAILISMYVILAFALMYLFFPNSWDSQGKHRIMNRYSFFFKYMKKDAGMHEVYLEEKRPDLMAFEDFRDMISSSEHEVPRFFTVTAYPLYRWAVGGARAKAWILKHVDVMQGTWVSLSPGQKLGKGFILILAFIVALLYDLSIKILNALMLSINTFTTLGFGEIPIMGFPRYLAIIQGFIGWFMLTIFSVSLISQLLN